MAKYEERLRARELRRNGESLGDIRKKLGVSKSSVSWWCRDIELTEEQKKKLLERDTSAGAPGRAVSRENKIKERMSRLNKFKGIGKEIVKSLTERDLLIVGIALYWAEGNKKERRLIFTNSDPVMIKIWLRWLRQVFGVTNQDIICYVGINEVHKYRLDRVMQYWSGITGVSAKYFRKPSLKKIKSFSARKPRIKLPLERSDAMRG